MSWQAFQSRHLSGGDYDPATESLTIQFVNGAIYRYRGVPQTAADSLFQTGSSRDYFNDKIKDRYPHEKLLDGVTKSGRRSARSRF
jgi:KTSC domain